MAEHAPAALAAEQWLKVRTELELAEKLGVPEGDHNRLQYRLGKAGFYTDSDPAGVIERLTASVIKLADDRAEGYNLLTQANLRCRRRICQRHWTPTNNCDNNRLSARMFSLRLG